MKYFSSRGMAILFAASFAYCTSLPVLAEEEDELEEVTVTGSFIKRNSFDSPVPLDIIDRADLQDLGAVGIEEVLQNLTYTTPAGTRAGLQGGSTNWGGLNLRGLGVEQSLVLFNGRRVQTVGGSSVNISALVPQIAIERIEIVKDGAGALYGSDAVAGVANFITRNSFEGIEITVFGQVDDATHDQVNTEIAGIWGGAFDHGHFMMAMSYVDRTHQVIGERDLPGATGGSFTGSAGVGSGKMYYVADMSDIKMAPFTVPFSYNELTGTGGTPNPDIHCGIMGTVKLAWGWVGGCGYDFAPLYAIEEDQQKLLSIFTVDWDFSDTTTIHLEASYANMEAYRDMSAWPFNKFPLIPSYNPGSVEDAKQRQALCLAETGGDAACLDIEPIDLKFRGRIGVGTYRNIVGGGVLPMERPDTYKSRLVISADGELPFAEDWTWDAAFTYGESRGVYFNTDPIKDNVQDALMGLGGKFCDEADPVNQSYAVRGMINPGSQCHFWNPFLNAYVTADGVTTQSDPLLVNDDELMRFMTGKTWQITHMQAMFIDGMTTGTVMEMPNGLPLGMAVGFQYRGLLEDRKRDDNIRDFGLLFLEGDVERRQDQDMYALFGELAIPVLENLEVQLAVRFEDFGGGVDSTDPKIAMRYSPTDDINLRASWGTSFKVPNMTELQGSSLGLLNTTDGPRGDSYVVIQTAANPNLKPEQAEVWNVGLSWKPTNIDVLEGFSADLDWYSVDHTDKISTENHQQIVNADNESDTDAPDPRILRDPVTGGILRISRSRINADKRLVRGFDLNLGYRRDIAGYGTFGIQSLLSWYTTYDQYVTSQTTGVTTRTDGIGFTNFDVALDPLPEYKWNTTLSWVYDRHRTVLTFRYVPKMETGGSGSNEFAAAIGQAIKVMGTRTGGTTFTQVNPNCPVSPTRFKTVDGVKVSNTCPVDDFLTVDLQYTYRMPEFGFQQEGSILQLGIINATDEAPPVVNVNSGFLQNVHDSRGRMYYLRYSMTLF